MPPLSLILCTENGPNTSVIPDYAKLRYIAYNQTRHLLRELTTPGSDPYQQVVQNIMNGAQTSQPSPRMLRVYGRSMPILLELQRRANDLKDNIKMVFGRTGFLLETKCGGSGNGDTNGLPDCSWEQEMKQYILTFP